MVLIACPRMQASQDLTTPEIADIQCLQQMQKNGFVDLQAKQCHRLLQALLARSLHAPGTPPPSLVCNLKLTEKQDYPTNIGISHVVSTLKLVASKGGPTRLG